MKSHSPPDTRRASAPLRAVMEAIVLLLVTLAPWAFGSVEPAFEAVLYAGVALLVLLWAVRAFREGALSWRPCPVALCLAGLFLFGVLQVVPLPRAVLRVLSPAAARFYDELLPAERESLPPPQELPATAQAAGSTLSLCPSVTRAELVRYLALFLLFAAVRFNVASERSLRRLALVALVNGAALSFFAVYQLVESPQTGAFGFKPDGSQPYGTFICRNHFPFYVNVCLGLGAGLLLARKRDKSEAGQNWLAILNDGPALWTAAALAAILGGVVLSLSRGGAAALACGAAVLALGSVGSGRRLVLAAAGVALALGLGFVAFVGAEPVEARLATMWQDDPLKEGRTRIWGDVLPAARDFPLFGSGYGTFERVEPAYRTGASTAGYSLEHAHNDYLEALVEGGLPRLLLTLAVIAFTYRLGARALRRYRGRRLAGLVLGALAGFTTAVVHSFVDFGLHIPAVAFFVAVVCAHLAALGEASREPEAERPPLRKALLAAAPVPAAVLLALVLCGEGWQMTQAQSLRLGAYTHPAGDVARVSLLDAAAAVDPERVDLHLEAAQAHLARAGDDADSPHLLSALAHYIQARDLCPLAGKAQLRLGAHARLFAHGDPRETYLRRAKRVYPSDPELFYLAGTLELADKQSDLAIASWHRSLELSENYLQAIIDRGRGALTDDDWLTKVLPERPHALYAAAIRLHPEAKAPERRPYFAKAVRLLDGPTVLMAVDDLHLKAVLYEALGEAKPAVAAYEATLTRKPRQAEWRYEFARLLHREKRRGEARRELLVLAVEAPDHKEARKLLEQVDRELAAGE